MNVHEITFAEAMQQASNSGENNALMSGFSVARGRNLDSDGADTGALQVWMNALKPNVAKINSAIKDRIVLEGDIIVPIGLSVITGTAGSGKTTLLRESLIPNIPTETLASFLKIGEPGYFIPYTLTTLLNVIESEIRKFVASKATSGILMVDSLLSVWFDPAVTKAFSAGRGGASLGVPLLLQAIGNYALANGFRVVTVLHPVFADPEVIGSGISGVSSMFINRDNNSYIVRDYQPIDESMEAEDVGALSYVRREANLSDISTTDLNTLARTVGDDD